MNDHPESHEAGSRDAAAEDLIGTLALLHGFNRMDLEECLFEYEQQRGGAAENTAAARELEWFIKDAMKFLVAYQQKQSGAAELKMSTRAMCMVLGFFTAAGARESADLGRQLGLGKATVNKCVNQFLNDLKLEKLPNQRGDVARQHMTEARKEQLNHG
jgi:hypothetical protein